MNNHFSTKPSNLNVVDLISRDTLAVPVILPLALASSHSGESLTIPFQGLNLHVLHNEYTHFSIPTN